MRTYIIDGNKFSNIEEFFDEIDLIMTKASVSRQDIILMLSEIFFTAVLAAMNRESRL